MARERKHSIAGSKANVASSARQLVLALAAASADRPNGSAKLDEIALWAGLTRQRAKVAIHFAASEGWVEHNGGTVTLLRPGRQILKHWLVPFVRRR